MKREPQAVSIEEALQDLSSAEVPGCERCFPDAAEVVLPEFRYSGSILGPFLVKDATVRRCPSCGVQWFHRSESKRWERDKLYSLLCEYRPLSPVELTFARHVLQLPQGREE